MTNGYIACMGGTDKKDKDDARKARLADALRANLHRRKAQSRQRKSGTGPSDATKTEKKKT